MNVNVMHNDKKIEAIVALNGCKSCNTLGPASAPAAAPKAGDTKAAPFSRQDPRTVRGRPQFAASAGRARRALR